MLVGSGPLPLPQEAKEQMDQCCTHTVRNDIRPEARVSEKSALLHPLHRLISKDISAVQNSLLLGRRKRNTHLFTQVGAFSLVLLVKVNGKKKKRNSFLFSFRCTSRTLINANGIHAFRQECSQPQD